MSAYVATDAKLIVGATDKTTMGWVRPIDVIETTTSSIKLVNMVSYTHSDHLGSSSVRTDASGRVLQFAMYYPFGSVRKESVTTADYENDYLYTGKERDEEIGLYYYGARYYDGEVGKFMSLDPASFDSESIQLQLLDPQSWNTYSYTRNNPIILTDPDGEFWSEVLNFTNGFANSLSSNNTFGLGRVQSDNSYFQQGQNVGDFVSMIQGAVEMSIGGTLGAGGLVLDASGVGAVVGVPITIAGAVVITHGASVGTLGAYNLSKSLTSKPGQSGGHGAGKKFSEEIKNKAREESKNKCVFCKKETTRESGPNQSQIDHSIPKSRDGTNTLENAQNTCRTCNLKKGTQSTKEFLKRK